MNPKVRVFYFKIFLATSHPGVPALYFRWMGMTEIFENIYALGKLRAGGVISSEGLFERMHRILEKNQTEVSIIPWIKSFHLQNENCFLFYCFFYKYLFKERPVDIPKLHSISDYLLIQDRLDVSMHRISMRTGENELYTKNLITNLPFGLTLDIRHNLLFNSQF